MDRALYPDRDLVWECLSAFFHRKGSVHRLASIHLEYRFQPGVLADPIRHAKQYACRGGLRAHPRDACLGDDRDLAVRTVGHVHEYPVSLLGTFRDDAPIHYHGDEPIGRGGKSKSLRCYRD